MFSKACEYGIKATLYIASQTNSRVSLLDIAKATNSPKAFTAKVLQQLVKNDIIQSVKGPAGGFEITGNLEKVKLKQIVNAIDGDNIYKGCALGLKTCNATKPCPMHDKFKAIRDELKVMLETTSLKELTTQLDKGLTFLKR